MTADTGATGVAEIMALAHAYWSAPDEYVNAARSDLRAAATRVVAEREEAVRETQVIKDELLEWGPVEGEQ